MEVPSSTEWGLNKTINQFSPNTFIEVGEVSVDKKDRGSSTISRSYERLPSS